MELLTIDSKEEEALFLNLLNNKGETFYEHEARFTETFLSFKISNLKMQKAFGRVELTWAKRESSFSCQMARTSAN